MEKDRVVKKDISQQEVIDYFQQRLQPSRTGFVLSSLILFLMLVIMVCFMRIESEVIVYDK